MYNKIIGILICMLMMLTVFTTTASISQIKTFTSKIDTLETTADDWTMFRHDFYHTGYSSSEAPSSDTILWSYMLGTMDPNQTMTISSSSAVANGKVYIGSGSNMRLYCLNADTGANIWNYTIGGGGLTSSPAVVNGKVYICSGGNMRLYCLNADTGAWIWDYMLVGGGISSPVVANGKVYIGSAYKLFCLNADTGAWIWDWTINGSIDSSPAVANGKVYFGSDDNNRVFCHNADTGAWIWEYATGGGVYSSPAVVNGKVYFGSDDNKVYCLNANNGVWIWDYTTGEGMWWSSPAVANGKVYIGTDKLYCLNADAGANIWDYTQGTNFVTSPAIANGKVYICSDEMKLYCFFSTIGNLPPSVSITYPQNGYTVSGSIYINGTASDPNGDNDLKEIQVEIDNTGWYKASGTSVWSYLWNTSLVENGEHIIYAVAIDKKIQPSTMQYVTVNVNNVANQPPLVDITFPEDYSNISGLINISGIASDPNGNNTLTHVQVKIDDNVSWVTATGTTSWMYSWDSSLVENGLHTIYARSYDGELFSSIDSVNIMVNNILNISGFCPIDLVIYDPTGHMISKSGSNIRDATYDETDLDGDGDLDDHISIPYALKGEYRIKVTPESNADPNELFSIDVSYLGDTYHITQNTKIVNAPENGYVFDTENIVVLSIDNISGVFGVKVTIRNGGPIEITNIPYSLDCTGGFIIKGGHSSGVISNLTPGESRTIQYIGLYGIGLITINVQVAEVNKQAIAFLLGPLVLRVT